MMDLNNPIERRDLVIELLQHLNSVSDSIHEKDFLDYILDVRMLDRIGEKLLALFDLLRAENSFGYALDVEMEKMKTSEEDSKWTFPVEKALNYFTKDVLFENIKVLIDVSRSWEFDDYRARNFQNDLRQKMEMLRDWYKEEYELND